jgi:hypothetical protein
MTEGIEGGLFVRTPMKKRRERANDLNCLPGMLQASFDHSRSTSLITEDESDVRNRLISVIVAAMRGTCLSNAVANLRRKLGNFFVSFPSSVP